MTSPTVFFGKIGRPLFLFEEYPSYAYLFAPTYWAANLLRREGRILAWPKSLSVSVKSNIKGVENSKKNIANGKLVSFSVFVLH